LRRALPLVGRHRRPAARPRVHGSGGRGRHGRLGDRGLLRLSGLRRRKALPLRRLLSRLREAVRAVLRQRLQRCHVALLPSALAGEAVSAVVPGLLTRLLRGGCDAAGRNGLLGEARRPRTLRCAGLYGGRNVRGWLRRLRAGRSKRETARLPGLRSLPDRRARCGKRVARLRALGRRRRREPVTSRRGRLVAPLGGRRAGMALRETVGARTPRLGALRRGSRHMGGRPVWAGGLRLAALRGRRTGEAVAARRSLLVGGLGARLAVREAGRTLDTGLSALRRTGGGGRRAIGARGLRPVGRLGVLGRLRETVGARRRGDAGGRREVGVPAARLGRRLRRVAGGTLGRRWHGGGGRALGWGIGALRLRLRLLGRGGCGLGPLELRRERRHGPARRRRRPGLGVRGRRGQRQGRPDRRALLGLRVLGRGLPARRVRLVRRGRCGVLRLLVHGLRVLQFLARPLLDLAPQGGCGEAHGGVRGRCGVLRLA